MPHRLFIAIDLPEPVCRKLGRWLIQPPRGVRPVKPAQLHLTLHFLGDVEDDGLAALREPLAAVQRGPVTLAIRGTGVFPPRGRPTVLWAGVADSVALVELHAAIGGAIASCGLEVERRPYVPHITLARLTPAAPRSWVDQFLAETSSIESETFQIDRFHLYESRRLDGETVHSVVATFMLR